MNSGARCFTAPGLGLLYPATPEGDLDVDALCRLPHYLLDKGADGFYVGGSTGEGVLMSVAERERLTATVIAEVAEGTSLCVRVLASCSGVTV